MLVWEVRSRRKRRAKGNSEVSSAGGEPSEGTSRSELRKAQLAQWRDKFVQNLESAGLLLEKVGYLWLCLCHLLNMSAPMYCMCLSSLQEKTASEKTTVHFLKVSAPWDVLVYYAEELCQRAPLQVSAPAGWDCTLCKCVLYYYTISKQHLIWLSNVAMIIHLGLFSFPHSESFF